MKFLHFEVNNPNPCQLYVPPSEFEKRVLQHFIRHAVIERFNVDTHCRLMAMIRVINSEKLCSTDTLFRIQGCKATLQSLANIMVSGFNDVRENLCTQTYMGLLEDLYTMVYSTPLESVEQWQVLAQRVDKAASKGRLRTSEYNRLVELFQTYSSEIERATIVAMQGETAVKQLLASEWDKVKYTMWGSERYSLIVDDMLYLCVTGDIYVMAKWNRFFEMILDQCDEDFINDEEQAQLCSLLRQIRSAELAELDFRYHEV